MAHVCEAVFAAYDERSGGIIHGAILPKSDEFLVSTWRMDPAIAERLSRGDSQWQLIERVFRWGLG